MTLTYDLTWGDVSRLEVSTKTACKFAEAFEAELKTLKEEGERMWPKTLDSDIRRGWKKKAEQMALGSCGVVRCSLETWEAAEVDIGECLRLAGVNRHSLSVRSAESQYARQVESHNKGLQNRIKSLEDQVAKKNALIEELSTQLVTSLKADLKNA